MCNQIWNLEYIDLAHLLYKNVVSNIDKPNKSTWLWWRWWYLSWSQQVLEGKIYHKYWRVVGGFFELYKNFAKNISGTCQWFNQLHVNYKKCHSGCTIWKMYKYDPTVPPKNGKGPQAIMGHNWWSIMVTVCSNWWVQCNTKHTMYVIYCK